MEFRHRKLSAEARSELRICPIESVAPYALMLAPVYVYMKLNEKFVSVKGPLDFFTPEELARLRPMNTFFVPEFIEQVLPFRETARRVRALLEWKPKDPDALPPAPYELSDAILRLTGPLWGMREGSDSLAIEPFFVSAFVNEFCDVLDPTRLRAARDADVGAYELAVFRSSWAVWLALTLGWCDLEFLNQLRQGIFDRALGLDGAAPASSDLEELLAIVCAALPPGKLGAIGSADFANRPERSAQRLRFRLNRIRRELARSKAVLPSVYGEKGFTDG